MISINEISRVVSKGTTPTSVGLNFTVTGVPFIRGEDILGEAVNFSKVRTFISSESNELLKRSELQYGDVLITIAGTIGRVAYVGEKDLPANCNQAVAFVRCDLAKIHPQWLCYLLRTQL